MGRIKKMAAAAVAGAVLATPAAALAAPAAGPLQRLEIDRAAARTHPCGYNAGSRGGASALSQYKIVTLYYEHKEVAQVAAVRWDPTPNEDACELVFVRDPGDTLKSLLTAAHPFVEWAPISWGSEPFFPSGSLNKLWRQGSRFRLRTGYRSRKTSTSNSGAMGDCACQWPTSKESGAI